MENYYGTFFDRLAQTGIQITPEQRAKIEKRINDVLTYEPTVGVFGKTGVGKSSLCNALFGADVCPISDIEACTRKPQEVLLGTGEKGIKLLDVPGVGESQERDKEYAELYKALLPKLDLILWVVKADDRAMASEERFFNEIFRPLLNNNSPFFFIVNQVDKIEPFREWDVENREPGPQQNKNISNKIKVLSTQFDYPPSKFIAVSAAEQYNLTTLVNEIVYALPKEKQVSFYREVADEHKSDGTDKHVTNSFVDSVFEFVETVVAVVKDSLIEVINEVAVPAIKDFLKRGFKHLFGF